MDIAKLPKNAEKYVCKICDFKCSKQSNYKKHTETPKHIKNSQNDINDINDMKKESTEEYTCECVKKYNYYSGLWRHKKICVKSENIKLDIGKSGESISDASISGASISHASDSTIQLLINENKELINENKEFKNENKEIKNMILELVKSNNELQKQMIEVCQKIQPGNNNTINSHNKTFNLQLFLNEECKDAMNMSEFINSIELKISDLENMGKLGYVEGMSNIIIKQLNDTDMYKRPVHCSDVKRETLYVKEENKWEKDTQETKQMFKAVRGVDKKNYTLLTTWKETHPKCMDSKSHQSDEYMKVVSKVMDGDQENINKVIKKVAKEVVIEK